MSKGIAGKRLRRTGRLAVTAPSLVCRWPAMASLVPPCPGWEGEWVRGTGTGEALRDPSWGVRRAPDSPPPFRASLLFAGAIPRCNGTRGLLLRSFRLRSTAAHTPRRSDEEERHPTQRRPGVAAAVPAGPRVPGLPAPICAVGVVVVVMGVVPGGLVGACGSGRM